MIPHLWIVSRSEAHARTCLLQENAQALRESVADCSWKLCALSKKWRNKVEDYIQLSLFGKMFPEHSAATKETTSTPCWKNWPALRNPKFQSLDLRTENGQNQDLSPEMDAALRGELSTLNIGGSPSVAVESRLSWILEDNVPEKYYLSARACQGILNRASRRGKELPEILRTALLDMIEWWEEKKNAWPCCRSTTKQQDGMEAEKPENMTAQVMD